MYFVTTLTHQDIFCNKHIIFLSSLHVHVTQCARLYSKNLKANLKHLLGMKLATDIIFLVLLSVNINLVIYAFATSADCEIKYVDTVELKNI